MCGLRNQALQPANCHTEKQRRGAGGGASIYVQYEDTACSTKRHTAQERVLVARVKAAAAADRVEFVSVFSFFFCRILRSKKTQQTRGIDEKRNVILISRKQMVPSCAGDSPIWGHPSTSLSTLTSLAVSSMSICKATRGARKINEVGWVRNQDTGEESGDLGIDRRHGRVKT